MNASYTPAYRWFNQHAAEVRPPASNWRGAFVALRDGLDANDTARFSEASFGRSVSHNANRMVLIAQHFAAQGAAQEDPRTATLNPMASRSPKAMNDVGWRIWAGNYGTGRMRQLSPNASSIGRWRVGPKDQPYGRFARSFAATEGKTAMGFAWDRRLWGGLPAAGKGQLGAIQLRVVWYDGDADGGDGDGERDRTRSKGADAAGFALWYDAAGGCAPAFQAALGWSGRWVERTVTVHDARFGGGCASRAPSSPARTCCWSAVAAAASRRRCPTSSSTWLRPCQRGRRSM